MPVPMSAPHFLNCFSFAISFKIKKNSSNVILRVQDYLTILNPLNFHMNFKIRLYIPTKKSAGLLLGIALNLYVSLENIAILRILSLLTHDHGKTFYFFGSLIFFSNILKFILRCCFQLFWVYLLRRGLLVRVRAKTRVRIGESLLWLFEGLTYSFL